MRSLVQRRSVPFPPLQQNQRIVKLHNVPQLQIVSDGGVSESDMFASEYSHPQLEEGKERLSKKSNPLMNS